MDEIFKKHLETAEISEMAYLQREPSRKTAQELLEILAAHHLSAIEIEGCLEHTKFIYAFQAYLPRHSEQS